MTMGNLAGLRLVCVVLALVVWALIWRDARREHPHTWRWDYEDAFILLLLALILGQ